MTGFERGTFVTLLGAQTIRLPGRDVLILSTSKLVLGYIVLIGSNMSCVAPNVWLTDMKNIQVIGRSFNEHRKLVQ